MGDLAGCKTEDLSGPSQAHLIKYFLSDNEIQPLLSCFWDADWGQEAN